MNKSAIRNYAIWARVQLIEQAKQRAYTYEITKDGKNDPRLEVIGGKPITKEVQQQRAQLIAEINAKGFDQVMEEAAYTWFNRFIALRFMEVNGYLPTKVRVFTNENGEFKPEILKEAMTVELAVDREQVLALLDAQDNETLFKLLLIAQCNTLSEGLPYMFETISNWTELLFPAYLLKADSVIGRMVSDIPEDDWKDAVQIIGWLYQYYNSELKDETFALLKKNVKITKERIPAATQLFTPDWIVRYMVENSLGRLWLEGHPNDSLKSEWKYYMDEAEQEPEVQAQLAEIRKTYAEMKPEDIKLIDPCMGSGHILVYAFDVLMQIYTSAGWSERDAAKSILENNIYGLDIDDRAGQLAYFAVMMKARKYNRRILNSGIRPHVRAIVASKPMPEYGWGYFGPAEKTARYLHELFADAKEYGSILNVKSTSEELTALNDRMTEMDHMADYGSLASQAVTYEAIDVMDPLWEQAQIMSRKYDVVVTNPPYMGGSGMSDKLAEYTKTCYPKSKYDLFAVMIETAMNLVTTNGYISLITQQVWMFLTSFENLRKEIITNGTLVNMVHLGAGAFDDVVGAITTAFIWTSNKQSAYNGKYLRLIEDKGELSKKQLFIKTDKKNVFISNSQKYLTIPRCIIAYWISNSLASLFNRENINTVAISDGQTKTGNNDKYLRMIWEVDTNKIGTNGSKWVKHAKGGSYRKWYGNIDTLIDWSDEAREHYRKDHVARIAPEYIWFRKGISWNLISDKFAVRYLPDDSTFNLAAPSIFFNKEEMIYPIMGYLNSTIAQKLMRIINPTINTNIGDICIQPMDYIGSQIEDHISKLVLDNIGISQKDWACFEPSSEFQRHALIQEVKHCTIEETFDLWNRQCETRFLRLKQNEEEINSILIEFYNLKGELTPEVEDKDVTVRKADLKRDIKSLISYAVGVMLGRYSLDVPGLAFAGGSWDEWINSEAGKAATKSYTPDIDGVLPITDDEYFADDIITMFIRFLIAAYGEETLEENLKFIAAALGGTGSAREVIRNYFINDFFADHCSTYSVTGSGKRPIYWLFDSGKKNGFKCLIYMHRYQPDTIARIRTDYIHELQSRYRTAMADLTERVDAASGSERVRLNKQLQHIKDQNLELSKYEEKIHHLADQMIPIDLDDGVKVNYAKFGDVLAKIK